MPVNYKELQVVGKSSTFTKYRYKMIVTLLGTSWLIYLIFDTSVINYSGVWLINIYYSTAARMVGNWLE